MAERSSDCPNVASEHPESPALPVFPREAAENGRREAAEAAEGVTGEEAEMIGHRLDRTKEVREKSTKLVPMAASSEADVNEFG